MNVTELQGSQLRDNGLGVKSTRQNAGTFKTSKAGAFPPFIPGCGHLSDRREREREIGGPRNDRMELWSCYSRLVCDRDQAGTRVMPAGSRPGHRASGNRRGMRVASSGYSPEEETLQDYTAWPGQD